MTPEPLSTPSASRPSDAAGIASLHSILCTEELDRRPTRAPDYRRENRALVAQAQALADAPQNILQALSEIILDALRAESIGFSLLTEDGNNFYWLAVAGLWKPHIGNGAPRGSGLCGEVLGSDAPLLFRHPERRYPYFLGVTPSVEECLLVPFHVRGQAVGAVWVVAHDDRRKFDSEDRRMLVNLSAVPSAACQAVGLVHTVEKPADERDRATQSLCDMNEALVLGAVRQHELAEAAAAANAQMGDADKRTNAFLAMLAHELRNPLAPIRNALEIVKRADAKGDLMKPAVDTIDRQVRQMTRLIDDLLDVSRITRDKLHLNQAEIELASIVHQAIETARPTCEAAKHRITVTLPAQPVYLYADPARLLQVFGNLLHNACKFTKPGGRIALAVEQQDAEAVTTVSDSGVGIEPGMLPSIFEMFTQVDHIAGTQSHGGLGIGLTLVRRLVEMHGGTVQAFSNGVDQGSTFVVRLPALVKPAVPSLSPPLASTTPAITDRRILVVDDNHDAANTLSLLLQLAGNQTQVAFDGVEAVEAASSFSPDVILMDLGMPKLNGYDAARRIREQPRSKGIVIVAMTGWGQDEDRKKTADAGFDGHLVKPVEYAALTTMLAGFPVMRRIH